MTASVISISSNISVESVGSSFSRVILITFIFVELSVAPEVGVAVVASPARVLELDTHSSSEADPSKSLLPPVSVAHMVSPFMCLDDSKLDTKMPKKHVSPIPHDAMLSRWRRRVASRSSSPTTSTLEIPTATILPAPPVVAPSTDIISPVDAPPGIRRRRAILIRLGEDIPIGQLYRTHLGGPCRALTARKVKSSLEIFISLDLSDESVGSSIPAAAVALPAGVLKLDTHSSSEVDPSKSLLPPISVAPMVSPFLCLDDSESDTEMPERHVSPTPHDHTTSVHGRSFTARKSFNFKPSYRLTLRYTSHHLDHFTSRSSSDHSSSDHSSSGYSTSDHSSSRHSTSGHFVSGHTPPVTTIADSSTSSRFVYPPPARTLRILFTKDNVEEDIDADVLAGIEADATTVVVTTYMDVGAGIDTDEDRRGKWFDGFDNTIMVEEVVHDIYRHVMEIPLQRVEDIETGQRELEARSLIVGRERDSLLDQVASLERSNMRLRGTLMMESARADRFRRRMGFMESELSYISYRILPRAMSYVYIMTITRSGMTPEAIEELIKQRVAEALAAYEANRAAELAVERNGGGNGNGNPNRNDRGVMHVASECTYHDFVKCQPLNFKGIEGVVGLTRCALTWWNAHKRTIGADATFDMSWRELMKLMTERFQELTMMCTKMVPEEEDRVEKFIGGLPDNIQGNVIATESTRLQDVVRIANNLMGQKLKGYVVKNVENKRRFDKNQKDNHVQQPS
ncbi:hypothetical protein Tco_1500609 [Tanacetum coccineum]